jgi:hypothetical protein
MMAKLAPWYRAVTPREDLREDRPLDASEFAVHLDHIRLGRTTLDYRDPARFFDRTYLTESLLDLGSQVVRRLSGDVVETSAVFNMATQFGGGKTHALAALYHLAQGGEAARNWTGVDRILTRAQIRTVPKAATAVFVGTEFDPIDGRGEPGEPQRKTPWGEVAWQLDPSGKLFQAVAQHDEQGVAPGGDVIRKMLPDGPTLILMDELMNYVGRGRKAGRGEQLYNFLHNLSEEVRARKDVVLCVSIPRSELEMTAEDQADFDRFKKLLDRLGRAISMSNDAEIGEIIRRRLFDWEGLPAEGRKTAVAYASWVQEHAPELTSIDPAGAREEFERTYPFHPAALSVFERKWQTLQGFQRTRGVLRFLALWIAHAWREDQVKGVSDPLITLGKAPLDDQRFRDAILEQLGSSELNATVTTDIAGRRDSHALRLDAEAAEAIRKAQLHRRAATIIFFESNGGQSQDRAVATLSEIKTALGGPDLNLAELDTVLEGLMSTCYYLNYDRNKYRFGLRPNLNQMLVTRRGSVTEQALEEQIRKVTADLFEKNGPKTVARRGFPVKSTDVPSRPQLTLVYLGLDRLIGDKGTRPFVEGIIREHGSSGREFKSALLFSVADAGAGIVDAARNLLAWEDIQTDEDALARMEEAQKRTLRASVDRARKDLREAIWRAYRTVMFLGRDNKLVVKDLGQTTSSQAPTLSELIIGELVKDDEIVPTAVGASKLVRSWPPALTEWSTKAARDAFYASPALPRLLDPESIKRTIADAVSGGQAGYADRDAQGRLKLRRRPSEAMHESEVEISDEVFILKAADAQKLVEPPRLAQLRLSPENVPALKSGEVATFAAQGVDQYGEPFAPTELAWSATSGEIDQQGKFRAGDEAGLFTVTAAAGAVTASAQVRIAGADEPAPPAPPPTAGGQLLLWSGEVPSQKWMNLYTKVLSRFASSNDLQLTVSFRAKPGDTEAAARLEEVRAALRELGLDDNVELR